MSAILIKNANVYSPSALGEKDILAINGKIVAIEENLSVPTWLHDCKIIDAKGLTAVPGFIDGHVHITGGGGEGGFSTQVPPIQLSQLIQAGITTVGALLGTDTVNRTVNSLLAKAKSLKEEGVSVFMVTGGYTVPSPTITGSVRGDIASIEEIRGCKVAISDHRAAPVNLDTFMGLATDVRVGGMLCGYHGMLIVHVGAGEDGLDVILNSVKKTPHIARHIVATHINRSDLIFDGAVELAKKGGYLDITSVPTTRNHKYTGAQGILKAYERDIDKEHILMSSDGNGSMAAYGEDGSVRGLIAADVRTLHIAFVECVRSGLSITDALAPITKNVAKAFSLPTKGELKYGFDADILLLNDSLTIDTVVAQGVVMMEKEELLKKGTFE